MAKRSKKRRQASINYSSKLTAKFQATIPLAIREHLQLKKGDEIVYELLPDNSVIIRKTHPMDLKYFHALGSTMNEWKFEDDEQAYKDL